MCSLSNRRVSRRDTERGQAVLEFGFFVPLLFALLILIQQGSVLIASGVTISTAARAGADAAAAAADCENGARGAGVCPTELSAACRAVRIELGLPAPPAVTCNTNPPANSDSPYVEVQGPPSAGNCTQVMPSSPTIGTGVLGCGPDLTCPASAPVTCQTPPNGWIGFYRVRVVYRVQSWVPLFSVPTISAAATAYPTLQ
jgi:hypothetical protein